MYESYLLKHLKRLKFTKNYIYLSLLYGLSTLLIPFGVQLLVNNLTLTGLWISTFSFLLLIGAGLIISLLVKYGQFILVEFLQRHILNKELLEWYEDTGPEQYQSPYYFEMFKLLKSFSFICSEGIDFTLTLAFGVIAISFIHPAFVTISALFCLSLVLIRYLGRGAVRSSIEESNRKYELYYSMGDKRITEYTDRSLSYFISRNIHFGYLRRQSIAVFTTYFFLQMILLGWGIHLIQVNELSIGQLVSAEIISSNIFMNFVKLPKLLESFYDFETSCFKLDYAKAGGHL